MNLRGRLADFALADVVQLLGTTRRTGALRMQGSPCGVVFLENGVLVEATCAVDGHPVSHATIGEALVELSRSRGLFEFHAEERSGTPLDPSRAVGVDDIIHLLIAETRRREAAEALVGGLALAAELPEDVPGVHLDADDWRWLVACVNGTDLRAIAETEQVYSAAVADWAARMIGLGVAVRTAAPVTSPVSGPPVLTPASAPMSAPAAMPVASPLPPSVAKPAPALAPQVETHEIAARQDTPAQESTPAPVVERPPWLPAPIAVTPTFTPVTPAPAQAFAVTPLAPAPMDLVEPLAPVDQPEQAAPAPLPDLFPRYDEREVRAQVMRAFADLQAPGGGLERRQPASARPEPVAPAPAGDWAPAGAPHTAGQPTLVPIAPEPRGGEARPLVKASIMNRLIHAVRGL